MKNFFGGIFRRFRTQSSQEIENNEETTQNYSSNFFSQYSNRSPQIPKNAIEQNEGIVPISSPTPSRKSDFSFRSVKKRASITPEQFRKSLENDSNEPQTPLSISGISLQLSSLNSPFGSAKKMNEKHSEEEEKTEEIFDFEKSANQTPMNKNRGNRRRGASLKPLIRLVYTERMKQGEIEKRAFLYELSRLAKLNMITEDSRDQIFSRFASQLDHFNQKKTKEDQMLQKQEKKNENENQIDPSKSPEEIMRECEESLNKLKEETDKWTNVEIPPLDLSITERHENEIVDAENVELETTKVAEDFIISLDKLILFPQTIESEINNLEQKKVDLAQILCQSISSQADPVSIVSSTKRN